MSDTVKIILDNYVDDVCYPGQTLAGRVECHFSKEEKVKAIKLRFRGRAKTEFTLRYNRADITHYGKEVYFDQEYDMVPGGDDLVLNAGTHAYPFSYTLPQSLPSSFEGLYGKVVYTIKVKVERPWKVDFKEKMVLNVVSPLDLNMVSGLQEPITVSVDDEVGLLHCLGTEPISFTVSLPCRGFVEGQDMKIDCTVKNMTNVNVQYLKFKIMQEVTFIGHTRTERIGFKEYKKFVTQCKSDAVGAHAEKTWTTNLMIPKNKFPNFIPCSVLDVTYKLQVKLVLPFPYSGFSTEDLPITLGTIPLSGTATTGILKQTTIYSSNSCVPPNTTTRSPEAESTGIHVDVIQQKNFYSNAGLGKSLPADRYTGTFASGGIVFPSGNQTETQINLYESNLNGRGPMVTSCFASENVSYVSHRTHIKTPSAGQRKYM